ncbi:MAG: flagellar hook-length control protein FliK, partial [Bdellovibrionales bacterium]|nr:flagellar hook-length control protein FliK [Bdellovibrionales bacterium]
MFVVGEALCVEDEGLVMETREVISSERESTERVAGGKAPAASQGSESSIASSFADVFRNLLGGSASQAGYLADLSAIPESRIEVKPVEVEPDAEVKEDVAPRTEDEIRTEVNLAEDETSEDVSPEVRSEDDQEVKDTDVHEVAAAPVVDSTKEVQEDVVEEVVAEVSPEVSVVEELPADEQLVSSELAEKEIGSEAAVTQSSAEISAVAQAAPVDVRAEEAAKPVVDGEAGAAQANTERLKRQAVQMNQGTQVQVESSEGEQLVADAQRAAVQQRAVESEVAPEAVAPRDPVVVKAARETDGRSMVMNQQAVAAENVVKQSAVQQSQNASLTAGRFEGVVVQTEQFLQTHGLRVQQGALGTESAASRSAQLVGTEGASKALDVLTGGNSQSRSEQSGHAAKGKQAAELPRAKQAEVIERIREVVESATKSRDNNTIVLRLDPPELGRLMIKLTHRGDELHGRVIAENAQVEAMLRGKAHELSQVLSASGLNVDDIHVTIGQEGDHSGSSLMRE